MDEAAMTRITAYVNMGDTDREKNWEHALASDNTTYLEAIAMLQSKLPKASSIISVTKLTKELLTHAEKAKIDM